MYKCLNCGNTEKFLGHAQEMGEVIVYKEEFNSKNLYEWIYMTSKKSWGYDLKIKKCFICNSENIIDI